MAWAVTTWASTDNDTSEAFSFNVDVVAGDIVLVSAGQRNGNLSSAVYLVNSTSPTTLGYDSTLDKGGSSFFVNLMYLFPDGTGTIPIGKSQGGVADLERTLSAIVISGIDSGTPIAAATTISSTDAATSMVLNQASSALDVTVSAALFGAIDTSATTAATMVAAADQEFKNTTKRRVQMAYTDGSNPKHAWDFPDEAGHYGGVIFSLNASTKSSAVVANVRFQSILMG